MKHNRNPPLLCVCVCIEPSFSQFFFWKKKKIKIPCSKALGSLSWCSWTNRNRWLSGFEVSSIIGTGGSLISQENWNRWLYDFWSFRTATPAVLWFLKKTGTDGSLIFDPSEKLHRRFFDFDLSERKAQTDSSLVLKTLRKKNRRLFLKNPNNCTTLVFFYSFVV